MISKKITPLINFYFFALIFSYAFIAKGQYKSIYVRAEGNYSSRGATSYQFYFRYGKTGELTALNDNGYNLREYVKVSADALLYLDKYQKYRNINKRNKVGLILSAVALLPGAIILTNGLAKPSIPLTAIGTTVLVGGTFGIIFCNARNKKSAKRAIESLDKSVNSYNQYIIDNKLSTQLEE